MITQPGQYAVDHIDRALIAVQARCVQCRGVLDGSPSDFWCGDMCQRAWSHRINEAGPIPAGGVHLHRGRTANATRVKVSPYLLVPNDPPPGPFESLGILIRRLWRKR